MASRDREQDLCADGALPVLTADAVSPVQMGEATVYTVRNGWAWAHIFVQHGQGKLHDGGPRGWVHVAVISDYGSFGYCWTHIGAEPWWSFVASLDMHYAMNKFLGERFHVPLSGHEAQAKAVRVTLDQRRHGGLTQVEARALYEAAMEAEADEGCEVYLRDWDRRSGGLFYRHELWDCHWRKVNPQAEGFWSEVWPLFVSAITRETPTPTDGVGRAPRPTPDASQ